VEESVPVVVEETDLPAIPVLAQPTPVTEAARVASLVGEGLSLAAQAVEYEIERKLHPEHAYRRQHQPAPPADLRSVVEQAENEAIVAHAVAAQANAAALAATARAAQARAQAAAEHAVAAGRAAQAANQAAAIREQAARAAHLEQSSVAAGLTGGNQPVWPELTVAVAAEGSRRAA
jgi:hypothetical protein